MKTSQEQDVTAAREVERPSLEELIARRRIKNLAAAQENRPLADASLLPNRWEVLQIRYVSGIIFHISLLM